MSQNSHYQVCIPDGKGINKRMSRLILPSGTGYRTMTHRCKNSHIQVTIMITYSPNQPIDVSITLPVSRSVLRTDLRASSVSLSLFPLVERELLRFVRKTLLSFRGNLALARRFIPKARIARFTVGPVERTRSSGRMMNGSYSFFSSRRIRVSLFSRNFRR